MIPYNIELMFFILDARLPSLGSLLFLVLGQKVIVQAPPYSVVICMATPHCYQWWWWWSDMLWMTLTRLWLHSLSSFTFNMLCRFLCNLIHIYTHTYLQSASIADEVSGGVMAASYGQSWWSDGLILCELPSQGLWVSTAFILVMFVLVLLELTLWLPLKCYCGLICAISYILFWFWFCWNWCNGLPSKCYCGVCNLIDNICIDLCRGVSGLFQVGLKTVSPPIFWYSLLIFLPAAAKDATDVLTLMTSFCILKTSTLMLDTRARCHFLKLIRVIFGKRSKSNAFHSLRHWIIGEFRGEGQNWCVQLVASLLATFTRMVHQLTQQLANLDLVQLKWFLASKGIA